MSEVQAIAAAPPVRMEPHEWEIVRETLSRCAPGRSVWAYRSRATGRRLKQYSDLDLVVGPPALSGVEHANLVDAFDESRLPFKVELQEWEQVCAEFRARIEPDLVLVQAGSPSVRS